MCRAALAVLGPMASGLDANLTNLAAIFAVVTAGIATTIGLYRPEVCLERRHLVVTAAVAGLVAFPILLLVSGGFHIDLTGWVMFWLALVLMVWQAGILATHLAFSAVVPRDGMVRRVLILGSEPRAVRLAEMLRSRRVRLFEPVIAAGASHPLAQPASPAAHLGRRRRRPGSERNPTPPTLLDSKLRGTRVLSATAFCEQHLGRIDLDTVDAHWLLCAEGFAQGRLTNVLKRALDVTGQPVAAGADPAGDAADRAADQARQPGTGALPPAAPRPARRGVHLFKFRSMRVDAEARGNPRWAQQQDPRVTRVGRFIRPMRIDELPQLINVLLGEMSMIGPRPERPHFVEQLSQVIPLYRQRAYVKPGITGWAQVNYPVRRLGRGCPREAGLRPLLREEPQPVARSADPVRHGAGHPVP